MPVAFTAGHVGNMPVVNVRDAVITRKPHGVRYASAVRRKAFILVLNATRMSRNARYIIILSAKSSRSFSGATVLPLSVTFGRTENRLMLRK